MALNMIEANQILANISTGDIDSLNNLVSQLDVTASGDVTVLWGGYVKGNTLHAGDIINDMVTSGQRIRILGNTEASLFLDASRNLSLNSELMRILGSDPEDPSSSAFQFLNGTQPDGAPRIPNGAWDNISSRFAAGFMGSASLIFQKSVAFLFIEFLKYLEQRQTCFPN